ncbi:MAG: alternative ribosome rescue aminoacyl-tRNA hydrolase ArfB [Gemmatimonadota bacterium]|nr:alternative ribosome rescue aminoacyl-tRNA hydrolase ArfB [Gemmatimonadota bacterium]MDH3367009.1 alternative ribosome rescue aminoacyl-tRNA hydrolase ArfB [Gemmatimonadota bacterium]MDH3476755.1 alternative ribosome rescue aminoacyl-tRNA hydrolase ArfB [Gemmatimonadota bacterium]MDH3570284.1 alternative ribosome rescue aminoacyl-tRNA hydrolase ArfB [Gemmatimonadota bacterium]MDH5551352.1 alternative ribosome rescue aminoacyl-tRNA hydrolase ArfB [Gemmatimonadota bacterium]
MAMKFAIPTEELQFRATRSGGPGGQHVNTSSTRVEVRWSVAMSPSLTDRQRERLLRRLGSRIDRNGVLRVVAAARRSQYQNRQAALERLQEIVEGALTEPKPRKQTTVSRAARRARLEAKRRRAATKRDRRQVDPDD